MMTLSTPWQFSVTSGDEIFEQCKNSDFKDCRINAYPEYTEYKGIVRQAPNFIFIDLDLTNFDHDKRRLNLALKKTLKNMKGFQGTPTVLWTGNGFHIYQPIEALILEHESIFTKDKFPDLFSITSKYSNWSVSEVFLKYAEIYFTNGKADPLHKPKYKTCLLRIPGSYNSKLLNKGLGKEESLVKVIQKWDGKRIPIQLLLKDFRRWITQEGLDQKRKLKKVKSKDNNLSKKTDRIEWIEKLSQVPLEDYRKTCLWRIHCPYLVNVKKLSAQEAALILQEWLKKCNDLRKTDFNHNQQIKKDLKHVGIHLPLSYETVKEKEPELYDLFKSKKVL